MSNNNNQPLTKFDPQSYADKLRDRMKASMVDIIPDEEWEMLLKTQLKDFFEDKSVVTAFGERKAQPSPFKNAVVQVLEEETKKRIREMLERPEWSGYWNGQEAVAGKAIEEMVKEHGADILNNWLSSAIQAVVSRIKYEMPR